MKHNMLIVGIVILGLFVVGCTQGNVTGNVVKSLEAKGDNPTGSEEISKKQTIGLSDLEAHNTEPDCWVAYDGKVYDITEFLDKHKSPLGKYCGTSTEFEEAYMGKHQGYKDDILNQFQIGILN